MSTAAWTPRETTARSPGTAWQPKASQLDVGDLSMRKPNDCLQTVRPRAGQTQQGTPPITTDRCHANSPPTATASRTASRRPTRYSGTATADTGIASALTGGAGTLGTGESGRTQRDLGAPEMWRGSGLNVTPGSQEREPCFRAYGSDRLPRALPARLLDCPNAGFLGA